ncbi:hypothetical protein RHODGE_RHODGE_01313 [Rhodoplanes serenus]|uniref:Alkaline proteinase inhibitor/ Outer membrane lipoprotein Omp19 domain-containing protein n=2 Tax=Nitrobacteraceae TaxID=41294 RepID=A0A447CND8_9BRAD|nr:hypothetical protein RHODGE_RHODGE_01313 [Rhodoplanes serenus]
MRSRPSDRHSPFAVRGIAPRIIVVLLGTVLLAGAARAQPQTPPAAPAPALGEAVRAMTGAPWEFSNADRDRRCTVTFRADAAAKPGLPAATGSAGMRLDLERSCTEVFPFLRDVVAWTLGDNDFLRFVDARGRPLLEFSEVEHGLYEAPKQGEGILFLQPVAVVERPAPSPNELAGTWTVKRSGRPLCSVTLATTPIGDGFALRLANGCDAAITRFAPTAWAIDRGELVLNGARNQVWRFEETEPKTWQRVPASNDPIQMVRP